MADPSYIVGLTNAAKAEVQGRFDNAETYVAAAVSDLVTALSNLTTSVNSITAPDPQVDTIELAWEDGATGAVDFTDQFTSTADMTWNPGTTEPVPFAEPFTDKLASAGSKPQIRQPFPTITIPSAPSSTMPADPGSPPAMTDHQFPSEPIVGGSASVEWPTAPTIKDIVIPGIPDVPYPTWDGEKVVINLTPPDIGFAWSEPGYTSEVKEALITKIVDIITNGGTGLGEDAEDALWDRMRGRKDIINERTYREAETYFSSRGFTLPPGALSGRLLEALAEQNRADEDLNADITFKQADLAYQATQAAIASGLQFEAQAWQEWNAIVQRAFEGQKYTIESAIQIFNAKVQYNNLLLENYKTEAAVYQSLMQGALARVEAYKAELQGKQITAEIQKLAVDTYTAQLQGVTLIYDIYKTRISVVQLKVEIDKLSLDYFRALIDVYTAKIQAKTAQFNLYQAQISGEVAKIQVYGEAVKAYSAEYDGYKADVQANAAELSAKADAYKSKVEAYKGKVDAYRSAIAAAGEKMSGNAKKYESDAEVFKAKSAVRSAFNDTKIKEYMTNLEGAKADMEQYVERVKYSVQMYLAKAGYAVEAAKASATAAAQRLASAMSGISATASMSASGTFGVTTAYHDDITETRRNSDGSGSGKYTASDTHSYEE
jgi:hypothetical protein